MSARKAALCRDWADALRSRKAILGASQVRYHHICADWIGVSCKAMTFRISALGLGAILLASSLSACATTEQSADAREEAARINDPLEIPNRFIFAMNRTVDVALLRPAAVFYRDWAPAPVKRGTRNVLDNLNEPVTAFNEVFQGEPGKAGETLARFVINSTVGVLGIFDVASEMGLPRTKEDFGQTLGVWTGDLEGGTYLMLPLIGPSNPRDAVGLAVDYLWDPFNIAFNKFNVEYLGYIRTGANAVDGRARTIEVLDDLERNSLDYYAAIRSAYRQRRAAEIRNDNTAAGKPISLRPPGEQAAELNFIR
jgi:phospholipid-binding lipoprotein MlaA